MSGKNWLEKGIIAFINGKGCMSEWFSTNFAAVAPAMEAVTFATGETFGETDGCTVVVAEA